MITTDIHASRPERNWLGAGCAQPVDSYVARATGALDQPLADESPRDAEGMNCSAVEWALAQDARSASASRLLIEIARRSIGGRCASTQIDLGRACKLSERQTRTLLASLIADKLVMRARQGGTGKGRAPDQYEMVGYVETAICEQPAIFAASQLATGSDAQVAATGNGQSSPGAPPATGSFYRQSFPVEATGNGAPTPPIRTTSPVEDNLQAPEPSFDRGPGGELFDGLPAAPPAEKPKPKGTKRRPRREKFYATEESMPAEPNEEMAKYAASKKMVNGTRTEQFGKFCRYHIRKRTLIASIEGRWETWVDNWAKDNPARPDGAPVGYKLAGVGADGKARYVKDHRTNVYR